MIRSHPTRPRHPSERVYPKISIEPKKSCISIYLRFFAEPNEPRVRSYSAEHQRVRTSPVQVPPQEDVGMPE